MTHKGTKRIPAAEMAYSVNSGRASLSEQRISLVQHQPVEEGRYGGTSAPASERTRSPRRKGGQDRAPWRPHPAYHREDNVRDSHHDRRPMYTDVRTRPDYERLREAQDRLRGTQRGSCTEDESNWSDPFPPEEDIRGSMGNRRYNRTTDTREPRPYNRDRQREQRHNYQDETHHRRRRD